MGIPLLQFLRPVGVRRAARTWGTQPSYARPIHSKLARRGKSQPPDIVGERLARGKVQGGGKAGEAFLLERACPEQHAEAAGICGAFHVERGVADIPRLARADAAAVEGEQHWRRVRLGERYVTGADEPAEMRRPAEMFGLAPQHRARLVADDAKIEPVPGQRLEQIGGVVHPLQAIKMDRDKGGAVDLSRLFPARTERRRKT